MMSRNLRKPFRQQLMLWVALPCLAIAGCSGKQAGGGMSQVPSQLQDRSDGDDWPAFGRTYNEQHFSPLTDVNEGNIGDLNLAWSHDLPPGNVASGPLEVDGTLYIVTGVNIVRAFDVETGKALWEYDANAAAEAGKSLRVGWGTKGLAWWDGKIFTGTHDGRLIALDAASGKPVWTVQTFDKGDPNRFISGPPRVFNGKIIIGHGGADSGAVRGYVTAYDAATGKQLWRFWTVPGDPSKELENDAMKMAAPTWSGEWWKYGGGGTVWNSITYDAEQNSILLGVGNGAPWNHRVRSQGKGDNLFLCSIVALDADTGAYKWHYQINPGESWDYNASMDMELADLIIDGKPRKVVMTAPKNGFFYVIDRTNGKLISAKPFAKVTWASGIDIKTGRPIENPDVRYPSGKTFELWPSPFGAHNWMPMSFSPRTGLVYLPTTEIGATFSDKTIDVKNWKWNDRNLVDPAAMLGIVTKASPEGPRSGTGRLQAWDPVRQKPVWQIPTSGPQSGGTLATAGNLVFHGQANGTFSAYSADKGKLLWSFAAQAPVMGVPISYKVKNVQYVTVVAGMGAGATGLGMFMDKPADYRSQQRRVLTFRIGGKAALPAAQQTTLVVPKDWDFAYNPALAAKGEATYGAACVFCHGMGAISGGGAPDLRVSPVVQSGPAFASVVKEGGLVPAGMPQFGELTDQELMGIRQYLRRESQSIK